MSKRSVFADQLRTIPDTELDAWLEARSGLPGPRANLELVAAVGDVVPGDRLLAWSELSPAAAPTGTEREFLPVCGVAGIGRLLTEASVDAARRGALIERLHVAASDPRWRVREAVAIAIQRWGDEGVSPILTVMEGWATSADRLVQRAVVAATCEPRLLHDPTVATRVIGLLATITATLPGARDRRTDSFRVLRQALGYGWSVAVAADPVPGWAAFVRWADSDDPDVTWLVRENLSKRRMPARPA